MSGNRGSPSSTASWTSGRSCGKGTSAYAAAPRAADGGRPGGGRMVPPRGRDAGARAGRAASRGARPIGAIKASLLAGDEAAVEEHARWTLDARRRGGRVADRPLRRGARAARARALGGRAPCRRLASRARRLPARRRRRARVHLGARRRRLRARRSSRSSRASRRAPSFSRTRASPTRRSCSISSRGAAASSSSCRTRRAAVAPCRPDVASQRAS